MTTRRGARSKPRRVIVQVPRVPRKRSFAIEEAERAADGPTRFRLMHLYRAAGRESEAVRIASELNLPPPPAATAPRMNTR